MYLDVLRKRRSYYQLSDQVEINNKEIEEIIKEIVVLSPTGFNMQSEKIIILFDDHHRKFWNLVREELRKIVSEDKFESTNQKMDMFSRGKGTILFFEDETIIEEYKNKYPSYRDNFNTYTAHSMGILQSNIWNGLISKNIGANLQHYNPIIDAVVKKEWNIPDHYRLDAQMVFGNIIQEEKEKAKISADERVIAYK